MSPLSLSAYQRLAMGSAFGVTDPGLIRQANDDHFLIDDDLSLVIVADGMGGHANGALASAEAILAVQKFLCASRSHASRNHLTGVQHIDPRIGPGYGHGGLTPDADAAPGFMSCLQQTSVRQIVFNALAFANECLFSKNLARQFPEGLGMGTTLTGLWQLHEGGPLAVFHVGDSRLYRFRDSRLTALTRDQTLYQRAIDAGKTFNLPPPNLLWQAVGPYAAIEPDISFHTIEAGDLYLLCSDGLHGCVAHAAMEGILQHTAGHQLDEACASLVTLAKAGKGNDNITAVLICCDG